LFFNFFFFFFFFLFLWLWGVFFFFFSLLRILWCSQSGNHSENNLAKFGYIVDMKVKKKNRNPSIFLAWLHIGSYHKTLAIWIFFSSKSGEFGPFFFRRKILSIGPQNHICQVEIWRRIWQNFASKRNPALKYLLIM